MNLSLAFALTLMAFVASLAGLTAIQTLQGGRRGQYQPIFSQQLTGQDQEIVFLFDGQTLLDATPGARYFLYNSRFLGGDWSKFLGQMSRYFPDLELHLQRLEQEGEVILSGQKTKDKPLVLSMRYHNGLTRFALSNPSVEGGPTSVDALSHFNLTQELDDLRDVLARAPVLVWRERAEGGVVWANSGYVKEVIARLAPGQELAWPMPRLFEKLASQETVQGQRAVLKTASGETKWYDLIGASDDPERLVFALPCDATVAAENSLREFIQTLTKTFAQLPIGLAIFDKQRQLQLFNPALLDLTGLPIDFLSLRPSLLSVLDALRDRQMIPEPKDYRGWRRQLVEMERAAASGQYEEIWDLPDGQTYKVIGRPHPNGGLALMIEDISYEVSRSRRYRSDVALGQEVIDQLPNGVAVFLPSGKLALCNTAYAKMWHDGVVPLVRNCSVADLLTTWRSSTAPGKLWSEAEEYITTVGNRVAWSAETRLLDGRLIYCSFQPLTGGSTMVTFSYFETASVPINIEDGADLLKSA